jgi:hypothetical protein
MKKTFLIIFSVFSIFFFPVFQVYAICEGPIVPCGGTAGPACNFCHIFELTSNILNFILTCAAPIVASLMIIMGGFCLLVSGSNTELLAKGKTIATAAIVGLLIIFIAYMSLNTLLASMGVAEWTGLQGGFEIECIVP